MAERLYQGEGTLQQALANGRRLLAIDPRAAAEQAQEILQTKPGSPEALQLLADALRRLGRESDADSVEANARQTANRKPALDAAAEALANNQLNAAEHILRAHLQSIPRDAAALTMLAEIGYRVGADRGAEGLLRQALEIEPALREAQSGLAHVLIQQGRFPEALSVLDRLVAGDAGDVPSLHLKAHVLGRLGEYEHSARVHEQLVDVCNDNPRIWMTFGDVLKTIGKTDEAIGAYRRAVALDPRMGEAWWSLANMKTVRFSDEEIAEMSKTLDTPGVAGEDRYHLHFALGKAMEDARRFPQSFEHYAAGNAGRRIMQPHDSEEVSALVARSEQVFTPHFLKTRAGQGCLSRDPIFILGMPRSGSTLVEQILASHSQVEGTSELPYVIALTLEIGSDGMSQPSIFAYLDKVKGLGPDQLRQLGEQYLLSASEQRKTARPFFIDKMPNNWMHVGLIHLMLPNAKIIDTRRDPMACCFSNFKQHFAQGQSFAYSLTDLGRYYRDYVKAMKHFDAVLPGRIHRIMHEELVENSEMEIRRMLNYLGLPFEESCLRFHENDRAVRTPSAEQVRRPITREGLDRWRDYEPWLGPLRDALGPVLDS